MRAFPAGGINASAGYGRTPVSIANRLDFRGGAADPDRRGLLESGSTIGERLVSACWAPSGRFGRSQR